MKLRERLIDFCDWLFKENENWDIGDWEIDDYLKSINQRFNETQAVRQNEDAENVCECDTPIIRSSVNMDGYCGNCGKDIK